MIAILDYSKIGAEVLEVGVENPNFGKSRGVLKTNRVANSVLAATHGNGVQSSCTFGQKVIGPFVKMTESGLGFLFHFFIFIFLLIYSSSFLFLELWG